MLPHCGDIGPREMSWSKGHPYKAYWDGGMDKVSRITPLTNAEHPWAIQAAMSFWSVSKEQDARSSSCSEPRSEKPHWPALHCHCHGKLLLLAITGMTSKEAGANIHFPTDCTQRRNKPLLAPFHPSRVQRSRLLSTSTSSTVNSILSSFPSQPPQDTFL